ncbi:MAG: hypothetical protein N3A72_06650 [bacterium]|nr:hypothetical protein [bacterium]
MEKQSIKLQLPIILALGSIWGLLEAAMGMALRGSCAYMITGSVMTGIAIIFFAISFAYSRNVWSIGLIFLTTTGFKLLDAYLLHLPFMHGAVANPIFGFLTESLAFLLIFAILDESLKSKRYGQAILGGLTALVAVNLFPLVKFVTGIPACIYPGTQYPLSLYFAPVAIGLSCITCPIGFALGEKLAEWQTKPVSRFIWIPANSTVILSLLLLLTMRLTRY